MEEVVAIVCRSETPVSFQGTAASVYKCAVDDTPHARRPLADDPGFLDSLDGLDHGLESSDGEGHETRPSLRPASPTPHVAPPPVPAPLARTTDSELVLPLPRRTRAGPHRRVPLPPSIESPFDALMPAAAGLPVPEGESNSRRPLIDLFPPTPGVAPLGSLPVRDRGPLPSTPPARRAPVRADAGDAPEPASGYETFYGLQEKPFTLSTDPRFFYHSTPHDAVSQRLLTAIREREGLVVLTGDVGAGKTTLCRTVIEQLDRRTLTSLVVDPFLSGEDLLKTVLADFGVMSRAELAGGALTTRQQLSTTLQSFVESLAPLGATAVVIIDEAQNLPPDALEQVRSLTEAAEATSLLQVILIGQPALTALLRRSANKPIHQRVTVRAALDALPADEIGGYVMHRLAVAGSGPRVEFADPALARLFQLSQGLPRVVNLLCDRALARGHEAAVGVIDAALVDGAAEDLDLGEPRSAIGALARRAVTLAAIVLCVLLGAGVAAWVFRDALGRTVAQWQHARSAPNAPAAPRGPAR